MKAMSTVNEETANELAKLNETNKEIKKENGKLNKPKLTKINPE